MERGVREHVTEFVAWYARELGVLIGSGVILLLALAVTAVVLDPRFVTDPLEAMWSYYWCDAEVRLKDGETLHIEDRCDEVLREIRKAKQLGNYAGFDAKMEHVLLRIPEVRDLAVAAVFLVSQALFVLPSILVWRRLVPLLRRPTWRHCGLAAVAAVFMQAYFWTLSSMSEGVRTMAESINELFATYVPPAVAIGFGVVVAPIVEEAYFRGRLYGSLSERWSPWFAIGVTSVVFSLAHGLSAGTLVGYLGLAVALGWLRWKTGTLTAPILAHMANNALAFVEIYGLRS